MARPNRAFKTVKIKASSFASAEDLAKMTDLYMEFEAKKTDSVEATRTAALAQANAQIRAAEAQQVQLKILAMAAGMENRIASSPNWLVYQEGDDKTLMFEGISERLMRNAFRAQTALMGKQVEGDDGGMDGMFEDEEDD